MCLLVGETLGQAVIDTGCPYTVSGEVWLENHIQALSRKDRLSIRRKESHHKFRFGDGKSYSSLYSTVIPIYVGNFRYELNVDIVSCDIPLLLSRDSLRRANAKIDVGASTIVFMGVTVPLNISSTGHMCLSICRPLDMSNIETRKVLSRVLFNSAVSASDIDLKRKAVKLHLQFCHPNADRLIDLLRKAGVHDEKVIKTIKDVTSKCDICIRHKKPPLRPAVGFPLASEFNETVALDLKSFHPNGYVLHIIDHLTRYSAACYIKDKKKETIIKGILDYWIRVFGSPKNVLTDNGGEFVNQDFIDLAEKFNINLKTTAAESPWSNGLCERHNGILGDNIKKIMASSNCSLDVAIHWATAAKNSLASVYGFSPTILVFGRNPNYPTGFVNKPPAHNVTCINDYVTENLNAMHAARNSFIQHESTERLRRALHRKSRTYANTTFCQGDKVYYWRKDQSDCHGPGIVIGKDGQQVLVKHGGMYIRVHPCRLQHCCEESIPIDNSRPNNERSLNHNKRLLHRKDNSNNEDPSVKASDEFSDTCLGTSDTSGMSTNESNPSVSEQDVDEWIRVNNKKDLPKVDTMIECKFPNQDYNVKCKILSKAGKSSTANWHYLNVQEDDGDGKCCSFKGVLWKSIVDEREEGQVNEEREEGQVNDEREEESREIFFGDVTESSVYELAKMEEIEKWRLFKTFKEVPDNGQKSISTRWVCTRKIKGGKVCYKARLVARGFEENHQHLQKDSPTCSKESLRISLATISSYKWRLHSIDIKSAFLQGNPMDREVFIKPPKEASTSCLWKMLRCPYGLADAGRMWYLRLKEELINNGMIPCKYDQALFMWFKQERFSGILICHVDDIVFGGCKAFHLEVISKLRSTFTIGLEEDTNLKYLGLVLSQNENGIHLSTADYGKSLKELPTALTTVQGEKFSADQIKVLKQFCGQVNWLSMQGRPDIAFDTCYISNSLKSGSGEVFSAANKLIRKVKNQNVTLHFHHNFDISSCSVVTFCDASFANLPNAGSQGGFISFLIDDNGLYFPVTWQSRKIRRVVKSTIGAECLAAVEAAKMTIFLATLVKDIFQLKCDVKTYVFCDNNNLVKAVHSSTNLEDKRLVIDISVLRDLVQQRELTAFLWVETKCQLADTLTKRGASDKLLVDVLNKKLHFNFDSAYFE